MQSKCQPQPVGTIATFQTYLSFNQKVPAAQREGSRRISTKMTGDLLTLIDTES
jgi:hypothetical protein